MNAAIPPGEYVRHIDGGWPSFCYSRHQEVIQRCCLQELSDDDVYRVACVFCLSLMLVGGSDGESVAPIREVSRINLQDFPENGVGNIRRQRVLKRIFMTEKEFIRIDENQISDVVSR